jgi:hypothetical protein
MPLSFTIVKYNFEKNFTVSHCFDRPGNLFCFESGKSQRDHQAMRPGFHDAYLPRARLSLTEGGIRRVQVPHDQ